MPKKTKLAKGRLDKYYWLAREQGYKSRAAFKLIQINKKFSFLENAKVCIDLCAAPGGWTQVCAKHMPLSSLIVAIDIDRMDRIGGCQTIQGDITLKKTETAVRRIVNELSADCVLNDGAPNVGGAWSKDAYGQCELSLHALKFATKFLRAGGLFVTKVFRSKDYNNLLWVCQQLFKKVSPFKPAASRMSSAETFIVCEGYLNPKKIDPRLLDPTFVFKDVELAFVQNVLSKNYGKKAKGNRSGYDTEMVSLLFKEEKVKNWIASDRPVDMLGKLNKLAFEKNDPLLEKATFDIKEMCADLKLLGKRDFRKLLKWRLKIRKESEQQKVKEAPQEDADKEEEIDDAQRLKEKLELDLKEAERVKKKERKKRRRKKLEARRKMAEGANHEAPDLVDPDLLTIKDIKDQKLLDKLLDGAYSDIESENESDEGKDSDDDDFAQLEADLDVMYEQYQDRQGSKARLKAKDLVLNEITEAEVEQLSDGEEIKDGLLEVKFAEDTKPTDKADGWFSQSIFDQVEESDSGEEMEDAEEEESDAKEEETKIETKEIKKKKKKTKEIKAVAGFDPETPYKEQLKNAKDTRSRRRRLEREEEKKQDSNMFFQEVSQDEDWSSDEEDAVAEVLAMGKQMLNKKKRERMINASYNRYNFDDPEDLPKWFTEEEREHQTPVMPVTKQDILEYKAYLKAVNARPLKKVAEAKARKKRKAMKEWEKMKKQATNVADNSELTERQKSKAIQKLYNKMKMKNRNKTPIVKMITTKTGTRMQRKGSNVKGAKKVRVDGRMKKDARRERQKAKTGQKRKQSQGKSRSKGRKAKRRRN